MKRTLIILLVLVIGLSAAWAQRRLFLQTTKRVAAGGGGGGSGSLYTTNNLAAWYDARTFSGTSDGTAIAAWTNAWANAHHMTNGNGVSQPTFKVNVSGSLPAFRFDNSDDYYTNGLRLQRPFTLMVIEKNNGVTAGGHRTLNGEGQNSLISVTARDSGNTVYVNGNVADFQAESTKPHIAFLVVSNASGGSYYTVDNTNKTATATTAQDWEYLTMGNRGNFEEPAACDVLHLMVYTNIALTADQMLTNYYYFKNIDSNIP